MPTLEVSVVENSGYRRLVTDYWALTAASHAAGAYSGTYYKYGAGFRFQGITIPQGATIDVAYVRFQARSAYSGANCLTRISAEDVDDAAAFADDSGAFDTRWAARTAARVDWDNIESWSINSYYNSPETKTVIQEIVDRGGWSSGNNLVIFWEDFEGRSTAATGNLRDAFGYDTGVAPMLHIEYTEAAVAGRSFGYIMG